MIEVKELTAHNLEDAGRCDGTFQVESRLILRMENGALQYSIERVPAYQKRYPSEEVDYASYINSPGRIAFFAYLDRQLAGQIRLCRWWNRFAYVEDIVVDVHYRRQGVGRALIQRAQRWASDRCFPGIMLETQDNNVAACRLYQQCGFELAGFDRYLYRGINSATDEVALYWYWLCPEAGG